ncbi:MAG: VCBS repeat-containing protein, partial [Planctomycetota bacterium]|nr:VCBS repeat-containing protein [Planctomycetota bacterium]
PRGCHSGSFLRDLNTDGRPDLLLPMGDRLQLWMGADTTFQPGPDLGSISRLELRTDRGLLGKVGRKLVVPQLFPEDINGDGKPDLTVSDDLQIRQFVLGPEGFPSEPTRSLDLSPFRADLDDFGVDLGNLTSSIRFLVQDKWADLNGDGAMDLLILADGRIRVFLGGEDGVDLARERTRLKVRGNVFYIYPARIDKDDIPDLVLVRVEDLGIGKLLRAALFSWEIEFDFLVFKGKGDGDFEKRPFRERSANLKGDSLVTVYKGEKNQFKSLRQKVVRTCDYDGDGVRTDLVTLGADGRLQVWLELVSDDSVLHGAIEQFLQQTLAGDGDLEVGISTLTQWTLGRTSAMTSMTQGKEPDLDILLKDWAEPHALTIRDMDGDGREEVLAVRMLSPDKGEKSLIGYLLRF